MVALRKRVVGGEPVDWPQAVLHLGTSVACVCLYGYSLLEGAGGVSVALLFAVAFGSMGIAELLTNRRWVAGGLRLTALGLFVTMIALTLIEPELLWGI